MTQQNETASFHWFYLVSCLVEALFPTLYADSFEIAFLCMCKYFRMFIQWCAFIWFLKFSFRVGYIFSKFLLLPCSRFPPYVSLLVQFPLYLSITLYSTSPSLKCLRHDPDLLGGTKALWLFRKKQIYRKHK